MKIRKKDVDMLACEIVRRLRLIKQCPTSELLIGEYNGLIASLMCLGISYDLKIDNDFYTQDEEWLPIQAYVTEIIVDEKVYKI